MPSHPSHALLAALAFTTALATPITNLERIQNLHARANPCEPGGTPELYKNYTTADCPPPLTMDGPTCPKPHPDPPKGFFQPPDERCISYCEQNTYFSYDVEIPLDQPYCHGPMTCTVSTQKAKQFQWSYTGSPKFLEAIGFGITGGYNTGETTTQIQTKAVTLKDGECGYFTFLPILHESCGTVSEGRFKDVPLDHCQDYFATTGGVCNKQPYRSGDGKEVQGDTVLVRTDCSNRQRLPMDQQDEAYKHDGVAAPQSVYEAFANAQGNPPTTTEPPTSTTDAPPPPDTTSQGPDAAWSSAAAAPSAACFETDSDGIASSFLIYGINGWAGTQEDNLAKLHKEEDGCGALTQWETHYDGADEFQGHWRDTQYVFMTVGFFKGGCVERAIKSAGGPQLGCTKPKEGQLLPPTTQKDKPQR